MKDKYYFTIKIPKKYLKDIVYIDSSPDIVLGDTLVKEPYCNLKIKYLSTHFEQIQNIVQELSDEMQSQWKSDEKMNDDSKSPGYYTDDSGHDLFWHFSNGLMSVEEYQGFLIGNIFKYVTRHGKKDASATIEDLKKARNYLDELIEFESGGKNGN